MGEAVPESMQVHLAEGRRSGTSFDRLSQPASIPRHWISVSKPKPFALGVTMPGPGAEIPIQRLSRLSAKRARPASATFPYDEHYVQRPVNIWDPKTCELSPSTSGVQEQPHDSHVAPIVEVGPLAFFDQRPYLVV